MAVNRCMIHGPYLGLMCPSCNGSAVTAPPSTTIRMDPTPSLMRIAAALERIANTLEHAELDGVLSRDVSPAEGTP